ncbi:hypothetical protein ACFSMW_05585 [Virgibacillus halophilus]|uniref:YceG-like family protein n=1 Tax=Tigheibacillus halophilus TaxID=361280 RepID=A0ABU5CBI9_9BACI|nr:hypothetical protein [Virgibacillus halophilus]
MKHYIRSFALGLLVSGALMFAVYYFFDDSVNAGKNMTVDDMKETMAEKGYRVMSEQEYIDLSVHKDEQQKEKETSDNTAAGDKNSKDADEEAQKNTDKEKTADKEDKTSKEKEEKTDKETKKYTLHIKSGMPASEIGDMLEENGIIKDADKFNAYLEKHDYSPKVQQGKFKVNSDMDFQQLVKSFTRD